MDRTCRNVYVYSTLFPPFPWQSCNDSMTTLEVKHKKKKCSKVFISFKTSCIHPPKNTLLSVPSIINRPTKIPLHSVAKCVCSTATKNVGMTKIKPQLPTAQRRTGEKNSDQIYTNHKQLCIQIHK